MNEVFFIDLDGNVIESNEHQSHIGLAKYIVENNSELFSEYKKSGYDREDLFLLEYIGYTLGCNTVYDRFLVINREKTTKVQKSTQFGFVQEGFKYFFSDDEEKMSRRF